MGIDLDETVLVVAAEDELAKEFHFPFVLALGLQFVPVGGAQVFDALGELFLVEQYLVDAYQQLVRPVRIELACKAVIGQIGKVVAKDLLEPFEEGAFPGVPFGGDQTEDWGAPAPVFGTGVLDSPAPIPAGFRRYASKMACVLMMRPSFGSCDKGE